MPATTANAANRALVEELFPSLVPVSIGRRSRRRDSSARDASFDGLGAAALIVARACRWQGNEIHAVICPGRGEERHGEKRTHRPRLRPYE